MSLKAIKEGLRAIVHNDMDAGKCTKCRMEAEIAALEEAASTLGQNDFDAMTAEANGAEIKWTDMEMLMDTIAKEAE